jgi:hypothetical protein
MKSYNMRRLEFVSDKIEGRGSKGKVVRSLFGHPKKKNALG